MQHNRSMQVDPLSAFEYVFILKGSALTAACINTHLRVQLDGVPSTWERPPDACMVQYMTMSASKAAWLHDCMCVFDARRVHSAVILLLLNQIDSSHPAADAQPHT